MAKSKTKVLKKSKTLTGKKTVKPAVKKSKTQSKMEKTQKKNVINKSKLNSKPAKKTTAALKAARIKPEKKVIRANGKNLRAILANTPAQRTNADVIEKKVKKFKPNKKVRYSKAELKHFREIILLERKAIFESAKANMDALVDKDSGEYKGDNLTYSSHMAEQGTDEMEREKNYLFVQRDEKYLGYLQEALMRIDQGTYGICIDCKDEPKNLCRSCPLIVKERLELVPITKHCIECKNLRG
ncbi:MAG: conjugal transfer protein TraR [Ignavibacteria bacterium]